MNQHFLYICNKPVHPANFAVLAAHYYHKARNDNIEKWPAYQAKRTQQCAPDSSCFISHPHLITQCVHWNFISTTLYWKSVEARGRKEICKIHVSGLLNTLFEHTCQDFNPPCPFKESHVTFFGS